MSITGETVETQSSGSEHHEHRASADEGGLDEQTPICPFNPPTLKAPNPWSTNEAVQRR